MADPFTVHDLGCHCWPHVSESALSEAAIAGAVAEYRESKRTIATLRAAIEKFLTYDQRATNTTRAILHAALATKETTDG